MVHKTLLHLAWLKSAFAIAKEQDLYGVMILTQANMFEAFGDNSTGASRSGFADFIQALGEEVMAIPTICALMSRLRSLIRIVALRRPPQRARARKWNPPVAF
jgi:hypothetical protein